MIIKGKCYCDVCMKELQNTCETCFVISGANLDDRHECQERHYCKDHRVWYELWYSIRNGEDVGQLTFPKQIDEAGEKEKKEVSNLELYDIITNIFSKYYGYLINCFGDSDFKEYVTKYLDAEIVNGRLKVKGIIKNDK